MKKIFFCLLLILNYNLKAQNLQLNNLFQSNSNALSQTITSSYLKKQVDGSIYSNTVASGNVNIFGNTIDTGANKISVFSKLSSAGNLEWQSYITSSDIMPASYDNNHIIDLNSQGEIIYTIPTSNNSSFKSNNGVEIPLVNNAYEVIKLSNTGELQWKKSIVSLTNPKVSSFYDRNGDIIVWIGQNQGTNLLFDNQQLSSIYSIIVKLNGQTGNIIYTKSIDDLSYWIGSILFDENNEMYAFYEPFNINSDHTFNVGNIQIQGNEDDFNFLMVKFDGLGNPIWGKNFYQNIPVGTNKYSWLNDVKYDGTNFIMYEVIASAGATPNPSFLTINGMYHTNPYPNKSIANAVSKVSKTGNVLWSSPIFTSGTYDSNQFDIDEVGNSYIYGRWFDKITIEGNEHPMSTYSSNIIKFNSNGSLSFIEPIIQSSFNDYNQKISILSSNKIFIAGNTWAQSIKGQAINSIGGDNYYIAELAQMGALGVKDLQIVNNIKMYPNPAHDFIIIDTNEQLSSAKIYDISGKLMLNPTFLSNKIEIGSLPSGNYIVEIFNKSGKLITNKKMIKK